MAFNFKCFVLIIFYVTFLDGVKFRCDYRYSGPGWFKYHKIPATWADARLMCLLEGGELASPITSEIKDEMKLTTCTRDIFTGIHATFSSSHYFTIDGTQLEEIPHEWAGFEPDNKNNAENCLALNCEGKLLDVRCDEPLPYVCYRPYSQVEPNICGTPDSEYNFYSRTNKCYKFHTELRTFKRANFACAAEGGHLLILNSDEEANIIKELYARYLDKIIPATRKNVAFIGFSNWAEEGDWRTIHGQTLKEAGYAKFQEGEPNNATTGEACGSIYTNGLLNDVWCEVPFPFICEKRPNYPPVCDHTSA